MLIAARHIPLDTLGRIDITLKSDGTISGNRLATVERSDSGVATRVKSDGSIETGWAANTPRPTWYWNGSAFAYGGWYAEPGTTNMILQSGMVGTWITGGTTASGSNPRVITETNTGSSATHALSQSLVLSELETYTWWCDADYSTSTRTIFNHRQTNLNLTGRFDLSSKSVVTSGGMDATGVVDRGLNQLRCWSRFTAQSAGSYALAYRLFNGTTESYIGDTSKHLDIYRSFFGPWTASIPPSYIPTTTAAVARGDEYICVPVPWATVSGAVYDHTGQAFTISNEPTVNGVWKFGLYSRPCFIVSRIVLRRGSLYGGASAIAAPSRPAFSFPSGVTQLRLMPDPDSMLVSSSAAYNLVQNGNPPARVGDWLQLKVTNPNTQTDPIRSEVVHRGLDSTYFTGDGKSAKFATTYDYYEACDMILTSDYSGLSQGSGEIIRQWHDVPDPGEATKNPPIALLIWNNGDGTNRYYLNLRGYAAASYTGGAYDRDVAVRLDQVAGNVQASAGLPGDDVGQIVRWEWRIKWDYASTSPTGKLMLWKNGTLIYSESGTQLGFNDTNGPMSKLGVYKFTWKSGALDSNGVTSRTMLITNIAVGVYL